MNLHYFFQLYQIKKESQQRAELDRNGSARLNKPSIRTKAAARRTVSNVEKSVLEIPFKFNARKSNEKCAFKKIPLNFVVTKTCDSL